MSKWHTTEFCKNCAKEFCCTDECKYHLLHRIKKAREEIEKKAHEYSGSGNEVTQAYCDGFKDSLGILDKLIEEIEEK